MSSIPTSEILGVTQEEVLLLQHNILAGYVQTGKRNRKRPRRFDPSAKSTPLANNRYTAGREIDSAESTNPLKKRTRF